jgi:hypothetical protein
MKSIWILGIGLVVVILFAGCIGSSSSSKPVITPTPQIVYVTVLVTPTQSTVTPTIVETATPLVVATSPYFYMDQLTGKFYRQPPGYICTDLHPNWHVGPDGKDYLWCEDKI